MLLVDLLLLRPIAFRHACESPKARFWVSGFLIGTGVLYGILVAFVQRTIGGTLQGVAVEQIPDTILFGGNIVAGMMIAIMAHIGVALLTWLMARAVGGPGGFHYLYKATAYLLPLAWPALPLIVLSGAVPAEQFAIGGGDITTPLLALIGATLFLAGLYQVLQVTQATSPVRTGIAVALFAVFTYSILLVL